VHLDDESVAEYVRRKVGDDFLENYVEPVFRGPWSWEPEEISKAYLLSLFACASGGRVFTFDEGIGLLTRTLAERLEVRLETRVTEMRVREGNEGVRVRFQHLGGPGELHVDLAVCAVPGSRAPELLPDLHAEEHRFFDAVRYTPLGIVYYVLGRPPEPYERVYTRHHPSPFAIYQAIPGSHGTPGDPPRLYCEFTPQQVRRFRESGKPGITAELDAFVRPRIEEFYTDLERDMVEIHSQWWDDMLPAYYPGYIRALASFLEAQAPRKSRVYFCGDYLGHAHTGGACASGRRTAETIIRHWCPALPLRR